MSNHIVNLYITTWQGISLGATHYYATLQCNNSQIDLKSILLPRQAAKLNKESGYSFDMFAAGDEYRGFDTHEKAVEAGIKEWKRHFPDAKFLVLGSHSYIEPKIILDTTLENDNDLKLAAKKIVDKCEKIGWYDNPKNDALMDSYYSEWAKLVDASIYE